MERSFADKLFYRFFMWAKS